MMAPPALPVLFVMIAFGTVSTLWPGPKASGDQWTQSDQNRDKFGRVWPKHTFDERWWPGEGLPFQQPSPSSDFSLVRVVKTIRITPAPPEPPQEVQPVLRQAVWQDTVEVEEKSAPPPRRTVRKASLDICARHRMRKVHYGRTWRCRR